MQPLGDELWRRKAADLGLGRGHDLEVIQARLDEYFPGRSRARSLNHGVLRVVTISAAVASELRLRQTSLLRDFGATTDSPITRFVITIGQLDDLEPDER